jgi:hypothetical protein
VGLSLAALFRLGAAEPRADIRRDLALRAIEDDLPLRAALLDEWLVAEPAQVTSRAAEVRLLRSGKRVQVRAQSNRMEKTFSVILAREWNGPPETLALVVRRTGQKWPGWTQGSWVFTRAVDDGRLTRVRFFPRTDPNMYLQFRPFPNAEEKSALDVVVYGAYLAQALPVGLPFKDLPETALPDILALSARGIPRRYFEPEAGDSRDKRALIAAIQKRLPRLTYVDDGALDELGRYVLIKDGTPQNGTGARGGLNCSGFVKWVVDGILAPHTNEFLSIGPLKEPVRPRGSSFTEPYEALREPFFGLDWTRRLAGEAGRRLLSPDADRLEAIEVRAWPFQNIIIRDDETNIEQYPGFLMNAGFGIEGLQPLLYSLAIEEPDCIYLASINDNRSGPPERKKYRALTTRQHFHTAVLIPYFNEGGNFQIAVFESAAETYFGDFKNRYPGGFINLVRVPVDGAFAPPLPQ